jgi:hypothetical protein
VEHAAEALAQLPSLQDLHLKEADSLMAVAEDLTGLTSLSFCNLVGVLDVQQFATIAQNQGLKSLSLASALCVRELQPDLLRKVHIDSAAVQHAAVALSQLPSLRALHLEGTDLSVPTALAAQVTGLTSLSICTENRAAVVLGEQQLALVMQNRGLRSLSLVNKQFVYLQQGLQPDLLRQVLTSSMGLTQLELHLLTLDDQGLGVLLTHGTSITDLTMCDTSLTTSKADVMSVSDRRLQGRCCSQTCYRGC